jgi:hypothetical protein
MVRNHIQQRWWRYGELKTLAFITSIRGTQIYNIISRRTPVSEERALLLQHATEVMFETQPQRVIPAEVWRANHTTMHPAFQATNANTELEVYTKRRDNLKKLRDRLDRQVVEFMKRGAIPPRTKVGAMQKAMARRVADRMSLEVEAAQKMVDHAKMMQERGAFDTYAEEFTWDIEDKGE